MVKRWINNFLRWIENLFYDRNFIMLTAYLETNTKEKEQFDDLGVLKESEYEWCVVYINRKDVTRINLSDDCIEGVKTSVFTVYGDSYAVMESVDTVKKRLRIR